MSLRDTVAMVSGQHSEGGGQPVLDPDSLREYALAGVCKGCRGMQQAARSGRCCLRTENALLREERQCR